MENLIVILIVAAAAFYIGRKFYKQFKGKGGCTSGCSCSANGQFSCEAPQFPDIKLPDKETKK